MSDLAELGRRTIETYEELQKEKNELAHAERELEQAEAKARLSGRLDGKNDRERRDLMVVAYIEDPEIGQAFELVQECKSAVLLADIDYFTAERQYQVARYEIAAAHPDIKSTGLLSKLFG